MALGSGRGLGVTQPRVATARLAPPLPSGPVVLHGPCPHLLRQDPGESACRPSGCWLRPHSRGMSARTPGQTQGRSEAGQLRKVPLERGPEEGRDGGTAVASEPRGLLPLPTRPFPSACGRSPSPPRTQPRATVPQMASRDPCPVVAPFLFLLCVSPPTAYWARSPQTPRRHLRGSHPEPRPICRGGAEEWGVPRVPPMMSASSRGGVGPPAGRWGAPRPPTSGLCCQPAFTGHLLCPARVGGPVGDGRRGVGPTRVVPRVTQRPLWRRSHRAHGLAVTVREPMADDLPCAARGPGRRGQSWSVATSCSNRAVLRAMCRGAGPDRGWGMLPGAASRRA